MNASKTRTISIVIVCLACLGGALATDTTLAHWFRTQPLPGDLEKLVLLSEIFAHGLGVALILITVATLDSRGWKLIPRLAATAYISGLTANLFKTLVVRRRPNQFEQLPDTIGGSFEGWVAPLQLPWDEAFRYAIQSFPSAHTATAFGLAMGLSRLYPQGRTLFLIFAILAGLQRIVAQAHFPTDVVVGAMVGILIGSLLQRDGSRWERFWSRLESSNSTRDASDTSLSEKKSLSVTGQDDTLKAGDSQARGGEVSPMESRRPNDVHTSDCDDAVRRTG